MDTGDVNRTRLVGEYILGARIGSGSFAVVWRARHRRLGLEVAVKEIDRRLLNPKVSENLVKEISILRTISHPNIIHLYETIQTVDRIFLILEYCDGGDLSDYLNRHGRVSDDVARYFMRQLGAGLKVLQDKHLIHRDLKPQNLLLSSNGATPLLKIGDFGFARFLTPQGLADTLCGSPLYMAPEIIQNQKYDAKADLWSVGAILFQLVTGKPPFNGNNQLQLFQNILKCTELQFPEGALKELDSDCVDLCRSLLRINPVERLIFKEFFNHKFLQVARHPADIDQASPPPQMNSIVEQSESTSDRKPLLHSGSQVNSLSKNPNPTNPYANQHVFFQTKSNADSASSKRADALIQAAATDNLTSVVDSMELLEKEYVLVNPHFNSRNTFSYHLETSMQDNCTIGPYNCPLEKNEQDLPTAMRRKETAASSSNAVQNPQVIVSGPETTSSESTILWEVQGLSILHPCSRLHLLHQYAQALTELAQEKYNAGQLLQSFTVELVLLAIWKIALQICTSWKTDVEEGKPSVTDSTNESTRNPENLNLAPSSEEKIDFTNPLSACMWAEHGFIVAYDRAEKLSYHMKDEDAKAEMPDAMELIYKHALALGTAGAVDEYMDNKVSAAALYSKAMLLLTFIVKEATLLPLNPVFRLTPENKKQIESYIVNLRSHRCLMAQSFLSHGDKSLSK